MIYITGSGIAKPSGEARAGRIYLLIKGLLGRPSGPTDNRGRPCRRALPTDRPGAGAGRRESHSSGVPAGPVNNEGRAGRRSLHLRPGGSAQPSARAATSVPLPDPPRRRSGAALAVSEVLEFSLRRIEGVLDCRQNGLPGFGLHDHPAARDCQVNSDSMGRAVAVVAVGDINCDAATRDPWMKCLEFGCPFVDGGFCGLWEINVASNDFQWQSHMEALSPVSGFGG